MGSFMFAVCIFLRFAVTGGSSSQTVFIQTKQDLLMTVTEKVHIGDDDIFYWKFNKSKNIVRLLANKTTPLSNYNERIEFFSHNLSLVLKNVQLSDSGIYTAVVTRDSDVIQTEYNVTVQDPVSPVTVTVDSVSHSPESCNFTVSCTTDHFTLSHSFTCNNHSCEDQEEVYTKLTTFGTSLYFHLSNVSIICNHSNQVSWTNHTQDIPRACPLFGTGNTPLVYIVVVVAFAAVTGIIIYIVVRQRRTSKRVSVDNTVYEVPQVITRQPVSPTDVAPVESPTSTYSLLGPHTAPAPAQIPESPESPQSPQSPESLYATVNKPSGS